MKRINVILMSLIMISAVLFSSCNSQGKKQEEKKKITIAYVNWAEGIAMTNLAKAILEQEGYEVELRNADVAPVFASLANGDADVFMDTWLPVTHNSYLKEYGDKLDLLGVNYNGARIGLVVPSYVEINSIEEMNKVKEKFDGEIVGIDAGAGIMKTTEKAIEDYALDYDLMSASGPAMTATLDKKIKNKEWVVVTGWAPHWKFARYDLKFLEDPKNIYGNEERIETSATKGFSQKDPFAAEFFTNFSMDNQQLAGLMDAIAHSDKNEDIVAKEWMEQNKDLVNSWLPKKPAK